MSARMRQAARIALLGSLLLSAAAARQQLASWEQLAARMVELHGQGRPAEAPATGERALCSGRPKEVQGEAIT